MLDARQDASYFLELQTQTGWGQTLATLAEWCAPQPGWRVLDVGCGPGLLPALFARRGCLAFGVDLEAGMLRAGRLHPSLAQADVTHLPFEDDAFDLVTASNLLFLLADPLGGLQALQRAARPGGQVVTLNPSERLSVAAAEELANERNLQGLARQTLLNWAGRAEAHGRWSEADTESMFARAGLRLVETRLKVGPGFARLARGINTGVGDII